MTTLNQDTPVVLLTEHKSAYDVAIANQTGAVLQKPFRVAALAHAARSLLTMPPADDALSANQGAGFRDATTRSDDVREMHRQRYDAPYTASPSSRGWGINE